MKMRDLITLPFLIFMLGGIEKQKPEDTLHGAWRMQVGSMDMIMNIQHGYLSHASFDMTGKKFHQTRGGSFQVKNKKVLLFYEFCSYDKELVGKTEEYNFSFDNENLIWEFNGIRETWKRIDDNKQPLAGVWRITGRMQDGKINPMNPGPRKTLKILSAKRFQWFAINTGTEELFGTGGGTYTLRGGKYTENIEFFSRDSSRVGASLQFDGNLSGNTWIHKGMSSRGELIHEEWTRIH